MKIRMLATSLIVLGLSFCLAAPAWAGTIQCIGLESGGPGGTTCVGLAYTYLVTPAVGDTIGEVLIGTDDPDIANYTNFCLPAGWTMQIMNGYGPHDRVKTSHGVVTAYDGGCPRIMWFTGPLQTAPFELGFDHPSTSHDVAWFLTDNGVQDYGHEDWNEPVGTGLGPIHGPLEVFVPATSQWGLIALAILLVAAATLYLVRRRSVATAS